MKKALIYCRVSTAKQEEGTSLDSQESICREYAETNGYRVIKATKEVFTGAELFDRPKLALDRADIRAGKYEVLIIHSIDRLSRNIAHLAIIEEECRRAGCALAFVTEGLDNTAEGKLLHSVKAYVAEVERLKIRERSMRGKRAKLLMGKPVMTGPTLYGYDHDTANCRYTINESEAVIVRRIFRDIASGIGTSTLARALNNENIPSPFSASRPLSHWSSATIARMIRNPSYKGLEIRGRIKKSDDGSYILRDEKEHIVLPDGIRPALVNESLWDVAKDRLRSNKGEQARNNKRFFLLRGFVFCQVCDRRFFTVSTLIKGKEYNYYRCSSVHLPHQPKCSSLPVSVDKLDAWVWEETMKFLSKPARLAEQIERIKHEGPEQSIQREMEGLYQMHAKCESGIKRLLSRFRNIEDSDLERIIEMEIFKANREKGEIEQGIRQLESRLHNASRLEVNLKSLMEFCKQARPNLEQFDQNQRRFALETMRAKILCDGSKWHYEIAIPLFESQVVALHSSENMF